MAATDPISEALARLSQAFFGGNKQPDDPFDIPALGSSGVADVSSMLRNANGGEPPGAFAFSPPPVSDPASNALFQQFAQRQADARGARNYDPSGDAFSNALTARRAKVSGLQPSPDKLTIDAQTPVKVAQWYPIAKKYADQYQVPVEDVMAIIENESGGEPGARSGENSGGQGRAVGLMQLIPMYHGQDGADLTNPDTNIQRGVRYYAQAFHKRGKDSRKAMAEYFGGGGAFDAAGNVREDIGDINIKMGPYLDGKFLPAKQRWATRLAAPPTVAPSTTRYRTSAAGWSHVVPGGQGQIESGGTHGGHPAVDIFAPAGTPILAPVDGDSSPSVVSNGGNSTILKGADGQFYYFAHARDGMLGGQVKRGQVIGYVGNTGNARNTPSHLHYAVASSPKYFINWNGSGDLDPI